MMLVDPGRGKKTSRKRRGKEFQEACIKAKLEGDVSMFEEVIIRPYRWKNSEKQKCSALR